MTPDKFAQICAEAALPPIDTMSVDELRQTCRIYRGALLRIMAGDGGWDCDADCPSYAAVGLRHDQGMYVNDEDKKMWEKTP